MGEKLNKNTTLKEEESIDVVEWLLELWTHKLFIILLALLLAVGTYIKTVYYTADTYSTGGVIYVSSKTEIDKNKDNIDLSSSNDFTSTYIALLNTSDNFKRDVSNSIGNKFSPSAISSMMYVYAVEDTGLLKINVTASTADDAYLVANAIIEEAPDMLEEMFGAGSVTVVSSPNYNVSPNDKGLNNKLVLSAGVGAVIAAVIIIIRKLFDNKLHSSMELVRKYGLSILGEISNGSIVVNSKGKKKGKKKVKKSDKKSKDSTAFSLENILNQNTPFDVVETYKSIRTNIIYSIPKTDKGKVIVVTSPSPGEGKTTTSTNLAITFAQLGVKVIVVDCDLRKSRLHRYLQLERKDGITTVLCGFAELENVIKHNVRENLDVLTAGEIPSNPAEIIADQQFADMIAKLRTMYDYIIIDTPPVTVVTDAVIAMKQSDGVVLVSRQGYTTYDLLEATVDDINKVQTKIFGAIVLSSGEGPKKYGYYKKGNYKYGRYGGKYGYKYSYRYGYRYGYGYKYGDDVKNNSDAN